MTHQTIVVLALLIVALPALRALRYIHCSWLTALSPIWVGFLIVTWSVIVSWLLETTRLGLVLWLPATATLISFVVVYIDGLPTDEPTYEDEPTYGAGGLGDRVLRLLDDEDGLL